MAELREPLSEREQEILRLVATGAANKEIARQLVISPNTVKVHLRNIFTKIGVASRTEATLYALHIGLVNPGAAVATPTETAEDDLLAADGVGLPEVIAESPVPNQTQAARRIRAWQVAVFILLVVALVGTGAAGTRLLMPAPTQTSAPTVLSQSGRSGTAAVLNSAKSWAKKADLPAPRKGMGTTEYQNLFYLIGGETSAGVDGAVQAYDPGQDAWKALASKPTPVSDVQAVLLSEKIYVPGGRRPDGSVSDALEVYDPRQDTWESKASLPGPACAYALAAYEGQLYLFGGKSADQYLASVWVYNPQVDEWVERTPLTAPRAFAQAVVSSGKIFLMGGFDGQHALTNNEAYFPSRDGSEESPWESFAPLPQGRYAMATTQLAGMIYMVGGKGDDEKIAVPAGLSYAEQSNQWIAFSGPQTGVGASLAAFASGNYLYVLGGETDGGLSAANRSYQAVYTILVPLLSQDE